MASPYIWYVLEKVDYNTEFVNLFGKYQPRLMQFAKRFVRDSIAAEDIVSDSFVAFYDTFDSLPEDSNKAAYLMTIVKNNCLNYLTAQQNHLRIEKNIHANHLRLIEESIRSLKMCDPEALLEKEVMDIVRNTLRLMSETERTVFEKSRIEGKTYSEIARECGISIRHVTSIMQKTLARLRVSLKDYLK